MTDYTLIILIIMGFTILMSTIISLLIIYTQKGISKSVIKGITKPNTQDDIDRDFDLLYNRLVGGNLYKAKKEKVQNIVKYIVCILYSIFMCGLLILYFLSGFEKSQMFLGIIFLFMVPWIIILLFSKKKQSQYKIEIIKKIVQAHIFKITYKEKDENSEMMTVYKSSRLREPFFNELTVTDSMSYELNNENLVNLAVLHFRKKSYGGTYNYYIKDSLDGIIAQISQRKENNQGIIIKRNNSTEIKAQNSSSEFDEYFKIYPQNTNSTSINENIKEQLVQLYQQYKIMFEISVIEDKIYIRFFTGSMFENDVFGPLINKEKLYRVFSVK